jgi:ABC-type lipoprotein export system ATPase subunit
VVRIIVAGVSGSGKSTILTALKPELDELSNTKVYYEVSESNEGTQAVIDAYAATTSSNIFTVMIFVADLGNQGSLIALSDISKRFRGTRKMPQLYTHGILTVKYSNSTSF